MQQMETLPPKYLKPIIMQGKNSVIQRKTITLAVKIMGADSYSNGAEGLTTTTTTQSYTTGEFSTGAAEDYTTGVESNATGVELGAEGYSNDAIVTGDYANSVETGAEVTQEPFEATNFSTTTSTFTTGGATGAEPVVKLLRRGSGISPNEQEGIISTAKYVLQQGLTPLSNNTASSIKKRLKGDWLVIVYPQEKPIDFNMTCVQGNDYMYFTLNEIAYQVCRLR